MAFTIAQGLLFTDVWADAGAVDVVLQHLPFLQTLVIMASSTLMVLRTKSTPEKKIPLDKFYTRISTNKYIKF